MNPQDTDGQAPTGYLSAKAKRHFTVLAGVLGAGAFLLQFVLPLVLMVPLIIMMMPSAAGFKTIQAGRGAVWDGRPWLVQEGMQVGPTPQEAMRSALAPEQAMAPRIKRDLLSLAFGKNEPPREAAKLDLGSPWLLAGPDRLWIISSARTCYFADGQVHEAGAEQLGDLSRPFLYGGCPAVVEFRPDRQVLRVFANNRWEEKASVQLKAPEASPADAGDLQVVAIGETFHLFLQAGRTVYYRKGLPTSGGEGASWEPVRETTSDWVAATVGNRPSVFLYEGAREHLELVGLQPDNGRWQPFFSRQARSVFEAGPLGYGPSGGGSSRMRNNFGFGVYPTGGQDFVLVLTFMPFGGRAIEVKAGQAVGETRFGGGFPFPRGFMTLMMVPQLSMLLVPVLLAFVLSALMTRYRAPAYAVGETAMPYAPLWRRALAEVIDVVILGTPMAAGFIAMMVVYSDVETVLSVGTGFPLMILLPYLLMCAGVPWAIGVLLIYSFTEGRWGVTLGKWLFGIRVWGTDLKPCGFGRAIVRNLLRVVDGFFNFLVGILLVSLTDNRQRVGDLAARTVVVMAAPREARGSAAQPQR